MPNAAWDLDCCGSVPARRTHALRLAAVSALIAAFYAPMAGADPVTQITISSSMPRAVRLQVSEGSVSPCDASENRMKVDQWIEPGQSIVLTTVASAVCVRHTTPNFPESEWAPSLVSRTTTICGGRRVHACPPGPPMYFTLPLEG